LKCDEVIRKLPEYIAGVCTKEEMNSIKEHINECPSCLQQLDELNELALGQKIKHVLENDRIGKLMRKIRWKLIISISTFAIGLLIIFFFTLPRLYYSMSGITNPVLRASMDMVQFSQSDMTGGYSTGGSRIFGWDMGFFTSKTIGNEFTIAKEYQNTYYFGSTVDCPAINAKNGLHALGVGTDFIHPKFHYNVKKPIKGKWDDIEKLTEADVTVNISLNDIVSLEEIAELLKDNPDVKVLWMAVETGEEKQILIWETNYYVQWGIPGTFIDIDTYPNDPSIEFTPETFAEYKEKLNHEMEWLNKNKHRVNPDESLLKYQQIDNSVGSKAEYILQNGYKIYGVKLTGKSNDVVDCGKDMNIREISLEGMRFTEW